MEDERVSNPEENKDVVEKGRSQDAEKRDKKKKKSRRSKHEDALTKEEMDELLALDEAKLQKQVNHLMAGESIPPTSVIGGMQSRIAHSVSSPSKAH